MAGCSGGLSLPCAQQPPHSLHIAQLGSRACQELRHTARSDKCSHCTQSYSSYLQLSQPSTLQAWPKPIVAFIPTFGKYSSRVKCHHPHSPKRMCHSESVLCLPFLPMPDASVRAQSLTLLQRSGEVNSGEQSHVPALFTLYGGKDPRTSSNHVSSWSPCQWLHQHLRIHEERWETPPPQLRVFLLYCLCCIPPVSPILPLLFPFSWNYVSGSPGNIFLN